MSIEDIQAHFEAEWILLEDPVTDRFLDVKGGTVIWHSKSRDEVCTKAKELHPKRSAILYAGSLRRDGDIVH
jgi:hypothetical protein